MFEFLVLVLLVIGPPLVVDQQHRGNIQVVDECPVGIVQSPIGSYHRRYVDLDGRCAYSEALTPDKM